MRWPAEWERQAAVLIAWPHKATDWAEHLAEVEGTYLALARAVLHFEPLLVCVADAEHADHVERQLASLDARFPWRTIEVPFDDTWLRDSGPISLTDATGRSLLLDFRFDGWGGKFEARKDDQLTHRLFAGGLFGKAHMQHLDWVLEGGAIESDGAGNVLSTWQCLSSRHPELSRAEIEYRLKNSLQADRILWLQHGHLEGDDTDAHIDTLARFAPDNSIVYQACDRPDDPHFAGLKQMAEELRVLQHSRGHDGQLTALPWPEAIHHEGRRLPASYANYLVINDAVLVPAYDDPADAEAARRIGTAHPGRHVVSIPCRPLIRQNGSLHCVTMQLPAAAIPEIQRG